MKHLTLKEQWRIAQKKNEAMAARQADVEAATSIAFVVLSENSTIDDVTVAEHPARFANWEVGISYGVGNIRNYNGNLYRCVQAHTSQESWSPENAASLWAKIGEPSVEYPEWSQPIGAHDAYMNGDKVSYNNSNWVSTVDNNVWQPGVYGWDEVK